MMSGAAAITAEQEFVYNPGGLLPEVSEPAPWSMFLTVVGALVAVLLLPSLAGWVFGRGGGRKPRPAHKSGVIKLKD